ERGRAVRGLRLVRTGIQRHYPGLCTGGARIVPGQRSVLASPQRSAVQRFRDGVLRLARPGELRHRPLLLPRPCGLHRPPFRAPDGHRSARLPPPPFRRLKAAERGGAEGRSKVQRFRTASAIRVTISFSTVGGVAKFSRANPPYCAPKVSPKFRPTLA